MIFLVTFFIDLLTIPSALSWPFQKDDISTVESVKCMEKTLERIELFGKKNFEKLPNVRDLLSKIEEKYY